MDITEKYSGLRAVEVLKTYCEEHEGDDSAQESWYVVKAAEALLPQIEKLSRLLLLEYGVGYTAEHQQERCALYDGDRISSEVVKDLVEEGEIYNENVVYMSQKQYRNIFQPEK